MTSRHFLAAVCALLSLTVGAVAQEAGEWITLFDGETLDGWEQLNGRATYEVVDGAIVGTTVVPSPNSFLCTTRPFGDFELEFEVMVDRGLNSGVQIRSATKGDNPRGRVHGPQVEIESSPGQSGYVYGEATGRGWLSPEPKSQDPNVKAHRHFLNEDWNRYRIVARGARIQTWINDQPIADLTDEQAYETHPSGFIGLQVHSIRAGRGPFQVRWRNIRIRELQ
jgi:hypothetical protein